MSITNPSFVARVDWKETPEAHVLKVDLPGMWMASVVAVGIVDGIYLEICGERLKEEEEEEEEEKKEEDDKWHVVERFSGKFSRTFDMPENANMDPNVIDYTINMGVLTVTVPKKQVKKPEVESVEASDEPTSL